MELDARVPLPGADAADLATTAAEGDEPSADRLAVELADGSLRPVQEVGRGPRVIAEIDVPAREVGAFFAVRAHARELYTYQMNAFRVDRAEAAAADAGAGLDGPTNGSHADMAVAHRGPPSRSRSTSGPSRRTSTSTAGATGSRRGRRRRATSRGGSGSSPRTGGGSWPASPPRPWLVRRPRRRRGTPPRHRSGPRDGSVDRQRPTDRRDRRRRHAHAHRWRLPGSPASAGSSTAATWATPTTTRRRPPTRSSSRQRDVRRRDRGDRPAPGRADRPPHVRPPGRPRRRPGPASPRRRRARPRPAAVEVAMRVEVEAGEPFAPDRARLDEPGRRSPPPVPRPARHRRDGLACRGPVRGRGAGTHDGGRPRRAAAAHVPGPRLGRRRWRRGPDRPRHGVRARGRDRPRRRHRTAPTSWRSRSCARPARSAGRSTRGARSRPDRSSPRRPPSGSGTVHIAFAILPYTGDWAAAEIDDAAEAYRLPFVVAEGAAPPDLALARRRGPERRRRRRAPDRAPPARRPPRGADPQPAPGPDGRHDPRRVRGRPRGRSPRPAGSGPRPPRRRAARPRARSLGPADRPARLTAPPAASTSARVHAVLRMPARVAPRLDPVGHDRARARAATRATRRCSGRRRGLRSGGPSGGPWPPSRPRAGRGRRRSPPGRGAAPACRRRRPGRSTGRPSAAPRGGRRTRPGLARRATSRTRPTRSRPARRTGSRRRRSSRGGRRSSRAGGRRAPPAASAPPPLTAGSPAAGARRSAPSASAAWARASPMTGPR